MKFSGVLIRFNYLTDCRRTFHIEFESRVDALWFSFILNQSFILQSIKNDGLELGYSELKKQDTADKHVSEISSDIPYNDFLTPET